MHSEALRHCMNDPLTGVGQDRDGAEAKAVESVGQKGWGHVPTIPRARTWHRVYGQFK